MLGLVAPSTSVAGFTVGWSVWRSTQLSASTSRGLPKPCRAASAGKGDEVSALMADTEKLLAMVSGGTPPPPATPISPDSVLYCDVSGCTIMPVVSDEFLRYGPEGSMVATFDETDDVPEDYEDFELLSGDGWKLGYDKAAMDTQSFSAIVGSNTFTAAITLAEYHDFVATLRSLEQSINTLSKSGQWQSNNDAGEATFEKSTDKVWMQGRAPNEQLAALHASWTAGAPLPTAAFNLRFVFTGSREISGNWSATAVLEVLRALDGHTATAAAAEAATLTDKAVEVTTAAS